MSQIIWQESGGPPIERKPTRRGFGSTVPSGAPTMQVGSVVSTLQREGGHVTIRAPLADLAAPCRGNSKAGL